MRRSVESIASPTVDSLRALCVENENGCWLKIGVKDGRYGRLVLGGIEQNAHRIAWEVVNGPMPRELSACHRCNTPRCMNPSHIYAATNRQNLIDAGRDGLLSKPGRPAYGPSLANKQKTHCTAGHLLAGANVKVEASGSRRCITCHRAAARRSDRRTTDLLAALRRIAEASHE